MPARIAFVSHHHDDLPTASEVSTALHVLGFTPFLAHRDLEGGSVWLDSLKVKISQSAVLVALFTPAFATSDWGDQEVGIAIGLGIPVVPISAGLHPYGFIGHIQGVHWGNENEEGENWGLGGSRHWTRAQRVDRGVRLGRAIQLQGTLEKEMVLVALESSDSWDDTRVLLTLLGDLSGLTDDEVIQLARAAAANVNLYDCMEFQQQMPAVFRSRIRLLGPALTGALRAVNLLPA